MFKIGMVITMVLVITIGCKPVTESQMGDEPLSHMEGTMQSTLFTDSTEFFIEYEPLEVGKESGFLVHITYLKDYKSCLSGSLTINIDGESISSDSLENPGIFHVPFTPARAGEFEITYTFESGTKREVVMDQVDITGGNQHDPDGDLHEDNHGHEVNGESAGEITLLKEQAWKNDFMVEKVEPVTFSSVILTSGEILAMPGEKKNLAANNSGIVLFSEKNLVQGSEVQQGQHLFTISSKSIIGDNVEWKYQEYLNSLTKSRSEYKRSKKLFAANVISERQYIASRTTFLSDSIRFYNLAENASQSGLNVYAPVSGYIHELNVSEGQYVELGQLLVTISTNKILLLRADVPQQYYNQLDEIETANFRLAYSDRTYTVEELNGHLLAKGLSVAENDHYLPVYFEVENDGSLLEGAFAEFFLKTKNRSGRIVVPLSAISEELGSHYIYLQVSGESFTRQSVSLGGNDGFHVEITEGLEPGDRIVTRGVMFLKAASMVTVDTGHDGHAH